MACGSEVGSGRLTEFRAEYAAEIQRIVIADTESDGLNGGAVITVENVAGAGQPLILDILLRGDAVDRMEDLPKIRLGDVGHLNDIRNFQIAGKNTGFQIRHTGRDQILLVRGFVVLRIFRCDIGQQAVKQRVALIPFGILTKQPEIGEFNEDLVGAVNLTQQTRLCVRYVCIKVDDDIAAFSRRGLLQRERRTLRNEQDITLGHHDFFGRIRIESVCTLTGKLVYKPMCDPAFRVGMKGSRTLINGYKLGTINFFQHNITGINIPQRKTACDHRLTIFERSVLKIPYCIYYSIFPGILISRCRQGYIFDSGVGRYSPKHE